MYILIGRTPDYAWSLTSAGHDVRDVYAEELCEPDGSPPTRASTHYRLQRRVPRDDQLQRRHARRRRRSSTTSRCTARCSRPPPSAGSRTPSRAALDVRPRRPQPRRAEGHDRGQGVARRRASGSTANQFGFTFNWAYVSRKATAYFSSGLSAEARRAGSIGGCRRSAPASTSGTGFLSTNEASARRRRSRAACCSTGTTARRPASCTATTSRTARCSGWRCSTSGRRSAQITDDVGIMNRAATEDVRSPVWPVVSRVLRTEHGPEPARPAGRRHPRRLGRPRRPAPRCRRRHASTTRPAR